LYGDPEPEVDAVVDDQVVGRAESTEEGPTAGAEEEETLGGAGDEEDDPAVTLLRGTFPRLPCQLPNWLPFSSSYRGFLQKPNR
jgi:hypothetical protein